MTTPTWYYIATDQHDGSTRARLVDAALLPREAARTAPVGQGIAAARAYREKLIASGLITGTNRAMSENYRYVREDQLTAADREAIAKMAADLG
jgi:hypothetical protein